MGCYQFGGWENRISGNVINVVHFSVTTLDCHFSLGSRAAANLRQIASASLAFKQTGNDVKRKTKQMCHGRYWISVQSRRFWCSSTFKLLQVALRRDTNVLLMDIAIFSFTTSSSSSPSTHTFDFCCHLQVRLCQRGWVGWETTNLLLNEHQFSYNCNK